MTDMQMGIVTGREIKKNRDGNVNRVILQVEIVEDEDVRTVELFSQAGEDVNPANGCRVIVLPLEESYNVSLNISDDIIPTCDPGEKEFYSTNNPVTSKLAKLKLNKDSEIVMNDGTDNPVKWSQLNTILSNFLIALNAEFAKKQDNAGSAGSLTLDLTNSKSASVFIP